MLIQELFGGAFRKVSEYVRLVPVNNVSATNTAGFKQKHFLLLFFLYNTEVH